MDHDYSIRTDLARIKEQMAQIDSIRTCSFYSQDFQAWYRETEALVQTIFGKHSTCSESLQAVLFTPLFLSCRCSDTVFTESYEKGLEEVRSMLASCLKKLE